MNSVIVSLGSNINKENNIPLALAFLHENCRVTAVSPIYETIPVGLRDQANFFNLAVQIETDLDALRFKEEVLTRLESHLKRTRQADPNAPRTIDADITLFNDEVFDYGHEYGRQRHIPDPDLLKFAHVAVPVADLLPNLPHPETGEPLRQIAQRLLETAVDENGRSAIWVHESQIGPIFSGGSS
jgi:2-amino-4-hydroxy-6-hydroxymethyldihydropteridine diphosphokinase